MGLRQKLSNQPFFGNFLSNFVIQHPVARNPACSSVIPYIVLLNVCPTELFYICCVLNCHLSFTSCSLIACFSFQPKENTSASVDDRISESALEPATDDVIESLISEASQVFVKSGEDSSPEALNLKLDLSHNDLCSTTISSDTSPPSTPSSARSLKSAIRRMRRIEHTKSVSFSEDVEVEVLVSPGKTKKGKKRPPVAKRRIERLKDQSQGRRRRYHSDSEVTYNPSGGTACYMEDFEEDFKKILPENKRTRNRHSSSESESGPDDQHHTNKSSSSKKTRGGAKKQRKKQQKVKRELEFANKQDDSQESGDNPDSPSSPTKEFAGGSVVVEKVHNKDTNSKKRVNKGKDSKQDGNNNEGVKIAKDDKERTQKEAEINDEVPLEFQDHTTKSEVSFQNEVMFELDD